MRLLIAIVLSLAVLGGIVVLIVAVASALATSTKAAVTEGLMKSGLVQKVAFGLLWLLVAGITSGLIGAV